LKRCEKWGNLQNMCIYKILGNLKKIYEILGISRNAKTFEKVGKIYE